MKKPVDQYWHLRLQTVKTALDKNGFETHIAADTKSAAQLCMEQVIPALSPKKISWGGSMTFVQAGLYHQLRERSEFSILDTYDKSISATEALERRRQALLTDLFITGTNAITEKGHLVNLDMVGNRVAALTFGPRSVVVLAGRNKVVPDLDAAMYRVKEYAAPANVLKLDKKTPCSKTGRCEDCKAPDRICNIWTITEKCFPKGRIIIVLINQDLGL